MRALKAILSKMQFPGDLERNRVQFVDKVTDPSLVPLVEELIREIDQRPSGYEIIVDSIVLQILVHLFRNLLRPSFQTGIAPEPRQLPSWQMVQALEYMNARGKSKFSLAELCNDLVLLVADDPARCDVVASVGSKIGESVSVLLRKDAV